jgi:cation diffusion facilitator family transporter
LSKLFQGITRVGIISLAVNLFLVAAKFVLAILTGSLALRADAIHSVIDVVASLAVIAGLVISGRRSRTFPYGLYKVENMVSLGVALLLFVVAYEIGREAITGIEHALELNPVYLGITGGLALVPLAWSLFETRVARRSGSPSLMADVRHFQTDVMSSAVVFLALLGQSLGVGILDRIGAGVVVLFILKAGWDLLKDSGRVLLDASLEPALINQVTRVVKDFAAVAEVKSVIGRNSGRFRFVEIEVTLKTHELNRAHAVSETLEKAIREQVPRVDRVVVHYEPEHKPETCLAMPVSADGQRVFEKFGEAPRWLFFYCNTDTGKLLRQEQTANPYLGMGKGRGMKVAEWLVACKVDMLLTGENLEGKAPGYTLGSAEVAIIEVPLATVPEISARLPEYVINATRVVAPSNQDKGVQD